MSPLSLNSFRRAWLFAAGFAFLFTVGAALPRPAGATNIDKITILFINSDKNFTAGVSTNTTGAQVLINCFINSNQVPDATGETMRIELVKSGVVQENGMPATTFSINSGQTTYGGASGPIPLTFFKADTGLQFRVTSGNNGTTGLSPTFNVVANSAGKLVVLAPGEELDPGTDPATSDGKTGTAVFQEPNQSFTITVRLTDNWYNPVAANHAITLTSGELISLPSGGTLVNGIGTYSVTITGAKTTRSITATDVSDTNVVAGSADVSTGGPPTQEIFPFPSPFNPKLGQTMTLRFRVSEPKSAKLKILDQFGQSLWQKEVSAVVGFNDVLWNGKNENGTFAASGVYYVILEIDGSIKSKKRIGVVK